MALFFSLTDERTYACIIADNERPELAAALEVKCIDILLAPVTKGGLLPFVV